MYFKGTKKEKWKGVQAETWESQELIETYKIRSIKQIIYNKYATNLKTRISQRSLRNSSLLLLLFEFNNFSFLIDIIDNIIYASGTCHQNSNEWQCSIIVTCLRLVSHDQYTLLPLEGVLVTWSVYLTYIQFSIILAQFYVDFSRQEHKIDVLSFNNSWDSQVSAYNPFNFSFKHNLTH